MAVATSDPLRLISTPGPYCVVPLPCFTFMCQSPGCVMVWPPVWQRQGCALTGEHRINRNRHGHSALKLTLWFQARPAAAQSLRLRCRPGRILRHLFRVLHTPQNSRQTARREMPISVLLLFSWRVCLPVALWGLSLLSPPATRQDLRFYLLPWWLGPFLAWIKSGHALSIRLRRVATQQPQNRAGHDSPPCDPLRAGHTAARCRGRHVTTICGRLTT